MDAKQIEGIIRRELDSVDRSELNDALLFGAEDYFQAIRAAAAAVAKNLAAKPEPPEPPKTVLPDMSGTEIGKVYWFFAEDGTKVSCWRDANGNTRWGIDDKWYSAKDFPACHPHLGRLREAIPGGWA